jgi:CheY-like chemotaxis protein
MKKKILVVDDEKDLRHLLKWFFESKGYEVFEAADGMQSLKLIKKVKPDLVLLDIMMPGMDGWEVSRQVKEDPALQDVPISMLSVRSSPEDVNKSKEYAHADVHISKPIDFYMLNKTVSTLTEKEAKSPKRPGRLGPRPKAPSDILKQSDSKNN